MHDDPQTKHRDTLPNPLDQEPNNAKIDNGSLLVAKQLSSDKRRKANNIINRAVKYTFIERHTSFE